MKYILPLLFLTACTPSIQVERIIHEPVEVIMETETKKQWCIYYDNYCQYIATRENGVITIVGDFPYMEGDK